MNSVNVVAFSSLNFRSLINLPPVRSQQTTHTVPAMYFEEMQQIAKCINSGGFKLEGVVGY